jgi:FkbM family methyltransferase
MNALVFKTAKYLTSNRVRGGYRLLGVHSRLWPRHVISYNVAPAISLSIPVGDPDHQWDADDIAAYEPELIRHFQSVLADWSEVTFIDCGADIGMFSAKLCAVSPAISRVIAFEPNARWAPYLHKNISQLPNGEAHISAVADWTGFGVLRSPSYDHCSQACFLERSDSGISVTTIDSLRTGGSVAIKIDVEGGELPVLKGAAQTIRTADKIVVSLEIHPKVIARIGLDPNVYLEFLSSLRPFTFCAAEQPGTVTTIPALDSRVLNIVAVSE